MANHQGDGYCLCWSRFGNVACQEGRSAQSMEVKKCNRLRFNPHIVPSGPQKSKSLLLSQYIGVGWGGKSTHQTFR